jgi:hypothetical protein
MARMMETTMPAIQALARRLIALESGCEPSATPIVAAVQTCDRLRVTLARLVGTAGFYSLMSRALAMAKREAPLLDAARVLPDGTLDGLDGVGHDADAGLIVVSRLLELLVTFIGEPLTLGLVNDAWPDAPAAGIDAGSGEGS